jgi:hypothetical protein
VVLNRIQAAAVAVALASSHAMLITFSCPFCGKVFEKDESLRGMKARCKDCGTVFVVPKSARPVSGASPRSAARTIPGNTSTATRPVPRPPVPRPGRFTPPPPPEIDDPYGLHDLPPIPKAAPVIPDPQDDEEFALPKRVKPGGYGGGTKRKRKSGGSGEFFDGLPSFVYLAVLGVLVVGFLLSMIAPTAGAYVLFGGGIVSFLVLFLYGAAGVNILPFRDGVLNGLLCWFVPFYLFGYLIKEWEMMKGAFLSYLASIGLVIVLALALPGLAAMRGVPAGGGHAARGAMAGPAFNPPVPGGIPVQGFPPPQMSRAPQMPGPPPGVQLPAMSNSLTLAVTGLNTEARKKDFGDKLLAVLGRVSGGYQFTVTDVGGRPHYQISTTNTLDIRDFVNQLAGVRVTNVEGQTIELVVP